MELDSKISLSKDIINQKEKDSRIPCDETLIKVGSEFIWLWVCCNRVIKQANSRTISIHRKQHADSRKVSVRYIIKVHGKHPSQPTVEPGNQPICLQVFKTKSPLHSSLEKSLIEKTMQYIKDRTEGFDNYFPCSQENCKQSHVKNWLRLFVNYQNNELMIKLTAPPKHKNH